MKKKNTDIQKSKKSKDKLGKKDPTTSLNLAINKLNKEATKSKGILDKINRSKADGTIVEKKIQSIMVLKRNCERLMNHLHQIMHHSLAMKVSELSSFIEDGMSSRSVEKIIDALDNVSKKHGFDFFKS